MMGYKFLALLIFASLVSGCGMSEEEIEAVVIETIANMGATGMKDMGKVMGMATKAMAGKADGKTISSIVRQKLA